MISRAAEYGLRTVLCLAKRSGRPTPSWCLAAATGVPVSYQSKILQGLRRVGIVQAHRGVGGGFVLARPAENLSIEDVIDAVDPPWFTGTGPMGTDPLGTWRERLREGVALMQTHFASISIAELCRDPAAGPGPSPSPRHDPEK